MAANTNPVFENVPYVNSASYTNADAADTKKDLVPAADTPAEGLRIDSIVLTSTETANARVVRFYEHDGANSILIGAINVPVNSGFDGSAAAVEAMNVLAPGVGYLLLPDAHKLQVENATQVAAGKTVAITARGGKLTA